MLETNFKQYKPFFDLIDQLFEIERKVSLVKEENSIARNINKMKDIFENSISNADVGFVYHNPMNESYTSTRLDLEASIAGNTSNDLIVTEVIKPIIRYRNGNSTFIARKGVVIVESKK